MKCEDVDKLCAKAEAARDLVSKMTELREFHAVYQKRLSAAQSNGTMWHEHFGFLECLKSNLTWGAGAMMCRDNLSDEWLLEMSRAAENMFKAYERIYREALESIDYTEAQ